MDKAGYVHKRKGRYMAKILESFETEIEPHLDTRAAAGAIQEFKGLVRARLNDLADDVNDLFALGENEHLNGVAQDAKDQLSIRPT